MHLFPRLKFCGFTRAEDVLAALDAGADAIGLNFYPASKRFVSLAVAESLSKIAHGHALRVGVFVNATPEEVEAVVLRCGLDAIQLHGDEPVAWLEQSHRLAGLRNTPVLRALPYRGAIDDAAVHDWSKAGACEGNRVMGLLIDAYDPIERGGTGKTAQWNLLYPRPHSFYGEDHPSDRSGCRDPIGLEIDATSEAQVKPIPILLAGGIRPDNLLRALQTAQPDGIDMASGIESAPGIKDHQAMMCIGQMVDQHFGQR
jgi:phosphoribosylanthranilate isomerase